MRPSPREGRIASAKLMIKATIPTATLFAVFALSGCSAAKSYFTAETLVLSTAPHTVTLLWQPSPGAKSYNVYRASRPGDPYQKIGSSSTTSFLDSPISAPNTLYYWVTAVNEYGESAPSKRLVVSLP
jgi:fibronectin type 3 domain-containing protein